MRAALKALRPYTALAPFVRLAVGLVRLFVRLVLACMAGDGMEKVWRAAGAFLLAGTAYRAIEVYPIAMAFVTVPFVVFAWRAGAPAVPPEDEGEQPAEVLPLTAEELAVAMHAVGAPHAHLAVLAAHMKTTSARVREGLTTAGIPVDAVRMKGRGVSTGVKEVHFPPLPSPAASPSEDVVAAGQSNNNNTKVTRRYGLGRGAQITVTPAGTAVDKV